MGTLHRFALEVNCAALVTESAGGPALALKVWIHRTAGSLCQRDRKIAACHYSAMRKTKYTDQETTCTRNVMRL
jgi:hypothetical protein